jgi:epoxyqueuosine reductase
MDIESFIRDETKRLGFSAVGFVPAEPSLTFDRFQEWLARGYAGDMAYLFRNAALRAHPSLLAPYVKSIIVVAARYPATRQVKAWSSYALGKDYHDVLRAKLNELAGAIRGQVSVQLMARVCVDTAPLLEREWACRAGLGWIGRQGSLVSPEYGCCLFLGALLVNLELEASPPIANGCGDCRLCVAACPTGAIKADGFVDARRCISYLTIEHKGEIPAECRSLLGSSLYGCDRCTAICPRNPTGAAGIMPQFAGTDSMLPLPEACLAMSEVEFARRFAGTAIHRLGLRRLQRNAANVLENVDGYNALRS